MLVEPLFIYIHLERKKNIMKIFTQSLQYLSNRIPQAIAFLSSRHCIFSSSVIPELLSDDACQMAWIHHNIQPMLLLRVLVLCDTMQFAQKVFVPLYSTSKKGMKEYHDEILLPLFQTKRYFSSTLQTVVLHVLSMPHSVTTTKAAVETLALILKVRSLKKLELLVSLEESDQTAPIDDYLNLLSSNETCLCSSLESLTLAARVGDLIVNDTRAALALPGKFPFANSLHHLEISLIQRMESTMTDFIKHFHKGNTFALLRFIVDNKIYFANFSKFTKNPYKVFFANLIIEITNIEHLSIFTISCSHRFLVWPIFRLTI